MKSILYLIILVIVSCNSHQHRENIYISNKDSIDLEKKLIVLKNWSFRECFSKSQINTYRRIGIDIKNSPQNAMEDLTSYYYTNNSDLDLHYIYEDKKREKLVEKWVNKKEYVPFVNPPDFPDGSLDMVRALDFYNSEDMKDYIDSVRQIELKRISQKNESAK